MLPHQTQESKDHICSRPAGFQRHNASSNLGGDSKSLKQLRMPVESQGAVPGPATAPGLRAPFLPLFKFSPIFDLAPGGGVSFESRSAVCVFRQENHGAVPDGAARVSEVQGGYNQPMLSRLWSISVLVPATAQSDSL